MKLGELISIKHGYAFPGGGITKEPRGQILLTPGNFNIGGGFKAASFKYFDGDYPREYELSEGDLLLTMTDLSRNVDTLGYPALIPRNIGGRKFLHNQRLGLARLIDSSLDKHWLYYRLMMPDYRNHVVSTSTGTTVHHTSPSRILEFSLSVPRLPEQRAIAATLGALDDKIESNREVISLIPQLIYALVEQAIEENGAIEVPVSSLGKFVNGGAYTKGASGSGRMVIRIAELNSGPGASTVYNEIDVPEERTAHPGDILMSWSGSLGVYVWYRPEAIVNQHIFKVIPGDFSHWFVFDRLTSVIDIFRAIAADKATTMGHIQRRHLNSTSVKIPEHGLTELSATCGPLWDRRNKLLQESLHLEQLRDTLLPELMSGRIRVPEAREAIDQEVGL
ncbi:restriction endonuclease subunit S [Trueperella pyogenes]|uniref:restriction endonuclease subunit S n=1 Tax=Trueperella pyogenes TaxID=1661 RepID=UPI003250CCC1